MTEQRNDKSEDENEKNLSTTLTNDSKDHEIILAQMRTEQLKMELLVKEKELEIELLSREKDEKRIAKKEQVRLGEDIYETMATFEGQNSAVIIVEWRNRILEVQEYINYSTPNSAYSKTISKVSIPIRTQWEGFIYGKPIPKTAENLIEWIIATFYPMDDPLIADRELRAIKQEKWEWVRDMANRLQTIAGRITNLDETVKISQFIRALEPDIQKAVKNTTADPTRRFDFSQVLHLAHNIESALPERLDPITQCRIERPQKPKKW